jgi:ferritin-like metal-binding protein YciE
MKLQSLHDLFVHELRDIYDAERQLVKALRRMAKAASADVLRNAFEEHLAQTEGQVKRLESVFEEFDLKPKGRTCEAMKGLVEEGKTIIDSAADEATGDAGLIAAAQKVEHYEIASYGCLETWAKQLGQENAARLLRETLDEEKQADAKLNKLAEGRINAQAGPTAEPVGQARTETNGRGEHDGHDGQHRAGEEDAERAGEMTEARGEMAPV